MAGTSLLRISPEIIAAIAVNLFPAQPGAKDQAECMLALLNLGRTCKLLRQIVRPLLYRRVSNYWTGRNGLHDLFLTPLVHTLMGQPGLASVVQELHLVDPLASPEGRALDDTLGPPFDETTAELNSLLQELRTNRRKLEESMGPAAVTYDPVVMLLQQLCVASLRKVHLVVSDRGQLFRVLKSKHTKFNVPMPRLTHLTLEGGPHDEGFELSDFRVLLKAAAPRLKTLDVGVCSSIHWPPGLPFPALRSLSLQNCMLSFAHLRSIVSAAPRLERFSHSEGQCCLYVRDCYQALPAQVLRALAPVAATLRCLDLDLTHAHAAHWEGMDEEDFEYYSSAPEEMSGLTTITSLEGFEALEELCLNYDAIQRRDRDVFVQLIHGLPALRSLSIVGADGLEIEDAVALATAVSRGEFPALKRVHFCMSLRPWYQGQSPLDDDHAHIKSLLKEGNVELLLNEAPQWQHFREMHPSEFLDYIMSH